MVSELTKSLEDLEYYLKSTEKKLGTISELQFIKSKVFKNITNVRWFKKPKAKRLLLKACKESAKIIAYESKLIEKEKPLLNFLNSILYETSVVHSYLNKNYSAEEKEFLENLKKNQNIIDEIIKLDKKVENTISGFKINLDEQTTLIKKDKIFTIEGINSFNALLEDEDRQIAALRKILHEELRDILRTNSLVFSTISKGGYLPVSKEGNINFDGLIFVHLSNNFPYRGVIRSSLSAYHNVYTERRTSTIFSPAFSTFSTVHFTVNGPMHDVTGVGTLSWKSSKVAIIIPGYNFPKKRIVHFSQSDSFVEGNVKIPPDSFIITSRSVFSSKEEFDTINREFISNGIRSLLVEESKVYEETEKFCEYTGRLGKIANHREALEKFAKSIGASYSFSEFEYDAKTISREFTYKQDFVYYIIKGIRVNKYNGLPVQENGLLISAEIVFYTLQATCDSFQLINKCSEDKRFHKPIAVLLDLISNLSDLVCIFILNEFKTYRNKENPIIKIRVKNLTNNITNDQLRYYLNHLMLTYTPDLKGEIKTHFNKTLKNIQSKVKLMQDFCDYIKVSM